jgi:iron-sulfur cluster repair protein YtfE (RIC family)
MEARASNATQLLAEQHLRLLTIFDELEFTRGDEARVRLAAHLAEQLKLHAAIEEDIFYPAVRALGDDVAIVVADALEAHHAADVLLDELIGAHLAEATTGALRDVVTRHIQEEEARLFPIVENRLDDAQRAALAQRIERYDREEEEAELGIDDAGP